jgi:phosphatidylinositol glycan class F
MTSTPERKTHSSSLPVNTLDSNLARSFTHIHPVLLLSLYYLRFDALVADPVAGLLVSSVPVAAIQLAYLAICLPPAGGSGAASPSSLAAGRPSKAARKGKASPAAGAGKGILAVAKRLVVSALDYYCLYTVNSGAFFD